MTGRIKSQWLLSIVLCCWTTGAPAQESTTTTSGPAAKAEALWAAARKGDIAAIEQVLKAGVDVNAKTPYGATALSFAVDRGHLDVVRFLLSSKADPNNKDTFYNATPMAWASMGDRYEIQKALVQAGAKDLDLALPSAVKNQDLEIVELIARSGKADRQALKAALNSARTTKATDVGAKIVEVLQATLDKNFPTITVDPAKLESYAGTYQSESGTRLDLVLSEGSLSMQLGPTQSNRWMPNRRPSFPALWAK